MDHKVADFRRDSTSVRGQAPGVHGVADRGRRPRQRLLRTAGRRPHRRRREGGEDLGHVTVRVDAFLAYGRYGATEGESIGAERLSRRAGRPPYVSGEDGRTALPRRSGGTGPARPVLALRQRQSPVAVQFLRHEGGLQPTAGIRTTLGTDRAVPGGGAVARPAGCGGDTCTTVRGRGGGPARWWTATPTASAPASTHRADVDAAILFKASPSVPQVRDLAPTASTFSPAPHGESARRGHAIMHSS